MSIYYLINHSVEIEMVIKFDVKQKSNTIILKFEIFINLLLPRFDVNLKLFVEITSMYS